MENLSKPNGEQREVIMKMIKDACEKCGFSEVEITEDSSPLQDARKGNGADNANLTTAVYKVDLHCNECEGCVKKVKDAVKACDGVENYMVDWESNEVTLVFGKVDPDKIKQKLEKNIRNVQLLSVKSGAPAVSGDDKEDCAPAVGGHDKEDKTKQINDRRTVEKTKENAVPLRVPKEEEVEMCVELAFCLKIKVKPDFANQYPQIYSPGSHRNPYPFPNQQNPEPSAPPAPWFYWQAHPPAQDSSRTM